MAVRVVVALLSAFVSTTSALVLPSAQMLMPAASARTVAAPTMFFFGGPKEDKGNSNLSGRDKDFANRQDKLAARQAKSATMPKVCSASQLFVRACSETNRARFFLL